MTVTAATGPQARLIDRAGEKIEPSLSAALGKIRPRFSLLTGSVFVLASMYLPLAVDSCGRVSGPGRDLLLGKENTYWPDFIFMVSGGNVAGRVFYVFLLAWAALTLLIGLLAGRRAHPAFPDHRTLAALAGALSFFVLADYGVDFLTRISDAIAWSDVYSAAAWIALILIFCVFCLKFEPVRAWFRLRLLALLGTGVFVAGVSLEGYAKLSGFNLPTELGLALFLWTPLILYFLVIYLLWCRYGLWSLESSAVNWPAARRRLTLVLIPMLAGQVWVICGSIQIGNWGLIPCLGGIHLMTLGYVQLARQAQSEHISPVARSAEPAPAHG